MMRLLSLQYPYPSLHLLSLEVFSLRTGKVSAACSCCRTYSYWTGTGLDWMTLPHLLPPKGYRGLLPGVHLTNSLGTNKVLHRDTFGVLK